jgi:hypothetical protein
VQAKLVSSFPFLALIEWCVCATQLRSCGLLCPAVSTQIEIIDISNEQAQNQPSRAVTSMEYKREDHDRREECLDTRVPEYLRPRTSGNQSQDDDESSEVDVMELHDLMHEIGGVLDHALAEKTLRAKGLDGSKQEQRRLVHALVHSKLNNLPRHPSKVHATLLKEREERLAADRQRKKRHKLVQSEIR